MVTPFAQGDVLALAGDAPWITISELAGEDGVVVLAPHPDDETLGCGGAIALAAQDRAVEVVVVTDGSKSHPASARYSPEALSILRRSEVRAAVGVLSDRATLTWLGHPDQATPVDGPALSRAVTRIVERVDRMRATSLWTTWEGDPHPDHRATAMIAKIVRECRPHLKLWSYPVWGRFISDGAPHVAGRLRRLDTSAVVDIKRSALAAHRSQMTDLIDDDPRGFVMEHTVQDHFVATPELFIGEGEP